MVATAGFRFSYWKQGTINNRLPAQTTFQVDSEDISAFGGILYTETDVAVTGSYEGNKPVIESANKYPYTVPINIVNTSLGHKFAGYSYSLEILDNTAPSDIFLQAGTNTSIVAGKISGDFSDSLSDVDTFSIRIDPESYLCKISEEPQLVPTNIIIYQGVTQTVKTVYVYGTERISTCLRTGGGFYDRLVIPSYWRDGGTLLIRNYHDVTCYSGYKNVVTRITNPEKPPTKYSTFSLTPPTVPDNWEDSLEVIIPMKMTRTIELYSVGSGIFGRDILLLDVIIKISKLRNLIAS